MLTAQALLKAVEHEAVPGEASQMLDGAGVRRSQLSDLRSGKVPQLDNASRLAGAFGLDVTLRRKGEKVDRHALFLAMHAVLDEHGPIEKLTPEVMHDLVGCYEVFAPMFHPVVASKELADSWFPKMVTLMQAARMGMSHELVKAASAAGQLPATEPTPAELGLLRRYLLIFARDFLAQQDPDAVKGIEADQAAETIRDMVAYMEFWAEEHGLPEKERREFREVADSCLADVAIATRKGGVRKGA
ncbi:MAG: hypothetical protein F4X97_09880 [Boseongicola sp. SB0662_bin_57]|nr:hypothetical protein [Boseongicola sp. SB0662_bin_57]